MKQLLCLVLFAANFVSHSTAECDFWENIEESQKASQFYPGPRTWAIGAATRNELLIFGGANTEYQDTWRYNLESKEWTRLANPPRKNFWAATGDAIGGRLYVFGGRNQSGKEFQNELWEYVERTNEWKQLQFDTSGKTALPPMRNGHTSTAIDDQIWVFGGWDSVQYFDDVWSFNVDTQSWKNNTSPDPDALRPAPRNGHSASAYAGKLIIFGGFKHIPAPQVFYNDMWEYTHGAWSPVNFVNLGPGPRFQHSAVVYGKFMFIYGGQEYDQVTGKSQLVGDLWMFDLEKRKWEESSPEAKSPGKRQLHTAISLGSSLYIFGGESSIGAGPSGELNDLWALDMGKCQEETYRAQFHYELEDTAVAFSSIVLLSVLGLVCTIMIVSFPVNLLVLFYVVRDVFFPSSPTDSPLALTRFLGPRPASGPANGDTSLGAEQLDLDDHTGTSLLATLEDEDDASTEAEAKKPEDY